jgi:hypothetical protein
VTEVISKDSFFSAAPGAGSASSRCSREIRCFLNVPLMRDGKKSQRFAFAMVIKSSTSRNVGHLFHLRRTKAQKTPVLGLIQARGVN